MSIIYQILYLHHESCHLARITESTYWSLKKTINFPLKKMTINFTTSISDKLWLEPLLVHDKYGQNGQIILLVKIFGDLPLFWKYIWMYHFFGTRVCCVIWVLWKITFKFTVLFFIKFKLYELKLYVKFGGYFSWNSSYMTNSSFKNVANP